MKHPNNSKPGSGFTLIEALIALLIVMFVIVSILSGFTYQMFANHNTHNRNVAITLAESRLEDYLKFPASQMPASATDFIVEQGHILQVYTADPDQENQFRRTVTVTPVENNLNEIRVMVEFPKKHDSYPFRVVITSRRGG